MLIPLFLSKQMIDLILPVIEEIERNSVASSLIVLQFQKTRPPIPGGRRW